MAEVIQSPVSGPACASLWAMVWCTSLLWWLNNTGTPSTVPEGVGGGEQQERKEKEPGGVIRLRAPNPAQSSRSSRTASLCASPASWLVLRVGRVHTTTLSEATYLSSWQEPLFPREQQVSWQIANTCHARIPLPVAARIHQLPGPTSHDLMK